MSVDMHWNDVVQMTGGARAAPTATCRWACTKEKQQYSTCI